jgi:transposase-like protein
VLEHRLVYENFHKCCILSWGAVHHKNENKQNNDISNLEGMMTRIHTKVHKTCYPIELEYTGSCRQCSSKHITRQGPQNNNQLFNCSNCPRKWVVPISAIPHNVLAYKKRVDFGQNCPRCQSRYVLRRGIHDNMQKFSCKRCKNYWYVETDILIKQLQALKLQEALDILREKGLI